MRVLFHNSLAHLDDIAVTFLLCPIDFTRKSG
jgi:hypothetical protein